MCGACGRRTAADAWTPILAFPRARWEEADSIDAALWDDGHPARVTATSAGWVTRSATGQGHVVDTATAPWSTRLSRSEVPVDLLLAPPARSGLHSRPPDPGWER
jgi:hypothetical protein